MEKKTLTSELVRTLLSPILHLIGKKADKSEIPDISGYAKKTDIPNVSGFVTSVNGEKPDETGNVSVFSEPSVCEIVVSITAESMFTKLMITEYTCEGYSFEEIAKQVLLGSAVIVTSDGYRFFPYGCREFYSGSEHLVSIYCSWMINEDVYCVNASLNSAGSMIKQRIYELSVASTK